MPPDSVRLNPQPDRESRPDCERRLLARHYDALIKHANDIILLLDEQGAIVEANDRAVAAYGYAYADLLKLGIRDLLAPEALPNFAERWRQVREQGGLIFETLHRRCDGTLFPVEISTRLIEVEGQPFRQSIARDISERKQAEQKILRLHNLYAALSQTNQAITRVRDRDTLFSELCRIATEYGRFNIAWVGLVDKATKRVTPVAASGASHEFLNSLMVSVDACRREGLGPAGKAFRKGSCHIVNDFLNDPDCACFHSVAAQSEIRSVGAFNLKQEGKPIGVFVLYADQVDFFDQPLIDLLYEMAADVSYALDRLQEEARRKQAEAQLRLWAKVFENSGEAIFISDAGNRILSINRAYSKITGYAAEDVVGRRPPIQISGEQDQAFYQAMWACVKEAGHWQGEIAHRRKNGEVYPAWFAVSSVKDKQGSVTHYIGIFSDITERKETEAHIHYLAHHDFLTGLPNRSLLQDRLEQAIAIAHRTQTRVALLFLDLDRFKNINDSLGHQIGDRLLCEVAERLRDCVRQIDTVSRQGGDEFVIVLHEIRDIDAAAHIAEKIRETLSRSYRIDGYEFTVTPSIGISVYPDDGDDIDTLIKNADAAMYHAKETGRNTYQFFTENMNARAFERLTMENNLRRALEEQTFTLCFQPQVEARTGRIIGAEVLLRWNLPGIGPISPGRFIPVAEDTGLIIPIGEWVLREACRCNRQWQDAGLPAIPLAVNLPAVHFHRQGLQATIAEILRESGLDGRYLELELTEGTVMKDAAAAVLTLQELKRMGCKCSIDDFGTGYSSLSYLKRFPLDKLKIDQSFIKDLATNPDDAEIIRAIIGMAHSLKLGVIAEGVETEEQLGFLRAQHCNGIQGNYYSKPVPAEEFVELLRVGRIVKRRQ